MAFSKWPGFPRLKYVIMRKTMNTYTQCQSGEKGGGLRERNKETNKRTDNYCTYCKDARHMAHANEHFSRNPTKRNSKSFKRAQDQQGLLICLISNARANGHLSCRTHTHTHFNWMTICVIFWIFTQ